MNFDNANLNLARKWRSRGFDQIIGQELSIKILKNSLFLNQFFPVYLFSGQRGTGKTSTARIFAAAVNCVRLQEFQKNPKDFNLPCLECSSCKAMLEGRHPDFIEIDAASNTGVENVRQIIEACSFMPIIGKKKIYLVDEAHMLSKAAFNAFLKIMEEPPDSVLFILATTSSQKIIETVKSRSLQVFFGPIDQKKLLSHLKYICECEKIEHEDGGLLAIIGEAQGSVRDSINILEQVRFSASSVTKLSVQSVLGHIDEESLLNLFQSILNFGVKELLICIKNLNYESYCPQYLWKKIVEVIKNATWIKYGVMPEDCSFDVEKIGEIVKNVNVSRLNSIMQLFYNNETVFYRTAEKHSLLEMLLIQISKKNDISNKSGCSAVVQAQSANDSDFELVEYSESEDIDEQDDMLEAKESSATKVKNSDNLSLKDNGDNKNNTGSKDNNSLWAEFIVSIEHASEPLISSVFKNAEFISFDKQTGLLKVKFSKRFAFFDDAIKGAKKIWGPILQRIFSSDETINLESDFTGPEREPEVQLRSLNDVGNSGLGRKVLSVSYNPENVNIARDVSIGKTENKQITGQAAKNGAQGAYPKDYAAFKQNQSNSKHNLSKTNNSAGNFAYKGSWQKGSSSNNNSVSAYKAQISSLKQVDVSDISSWQTANTILKYFSGNMVEYKDN